MFQIISTLAVEVPAFLQNIEELRGVSPNVQLYCEPWGHVDHSDGNCECLSSDRTAAYVHDLALMPRECLPVSGIGGCLSLYRGKWCADEPCLLYGLGTAGIGAICIS